MFNLLFAWLRGGKTNTAMIALVVVYVLNKYFGVVTDETHIVEILALGLGSIGQLHKIYKGETVQGIIAGIKAKKAEEEAKKPTETK